MSVSPPLPIPEQQYSGLAKLIQLKTEQLKELREALESAPLKFYDADLVAFLAPKVSIDRDDLKAIIGVLAALSVVSSLMDMRGDVFATSIAEGMNRTGRKELALSGSERKQFIDTISTLVQAKSISVVAKSKSLLRSFDNVLCRARTLTDVRPVFSDTPEKIEAMVIVHSLNISYHHGTQLRDFFVTLDTADLGLFIEMLQRAKAKAETLKAAIGGPGAAPVIDIE